MIKEQYVSFETAKLLKEKGFDEECWCYYHNSRLEHYFREVSNRGWTTTDNVAAPTQQMAMRWLREVHNIDINITCEHQDILNAAGNKIKVYEVDIIAPNGSIYIGNWNHYESAAEAAIRYCLEHLI